MRNPKAIPHILQIIPQPGIRREAMDTLCAMPAKDIVPHLVNMLDYPALRKLSHLALIKLTGKDFGENGHLWRKWLQQA